MHSSDIAVIGGGIVGVSCAFALAAKGQEVTLIDRDRAGEAASVGNAGVIATDHVFPLSSVSTILSAPRELLRRDAVLGIKAAYLLKIAPWLARFVWCSRPPQYRRGVKSLSALQATAMADLLALAGEAGIADQINTDGNLVVAETDRGAEALHKDMALLRSHGTNVQWADSDFVATKAPALKSGITGGLWLQDTGHVNDPSALCDGFQQAFERAGGNFLAGAVQALEPVNSGFELTLAGGSKVHAKRILVSAGAWSAELARHLGYRVPLEVERGYHLTASGVQADMSMAVASKERTTYLTPMTCGTRITTGVEFGGKVLPPTDRYHDMLQRHFEELLPNVTVPEYSRWMGYRPSLSDHLPVIGPSKRHPGAYFAFGHQHLGLTLSGVTARLVTEMMTDALDDGLGLDQFLITRF